MQCSLIKQNSQLPVIVKYLHSKCLTWGKFFLIMLQICGKPLYKPLNLIAKHTEMTVYFEFNEQRKR